MAKNTYRPDRDGSAKSEYRKNRARLIAEGDVCALCGRPIDKRLKFPNPMSATADHIIPISKGGSPTDPGNLQLTHLICNQVKSSKITAENNKEVSAGTALISNNILPLSLDWANFR